MQKRKFDELISHFNRKVSDMSIDQKYKMELLGMISAIGFAHEKELGTNLAEVGTDCISRQAAIDVVKESHECGWYLMETISHIEELPTVDAVEVVRCRDCKHLSNDRITPEFNRVCRLYGCGKKECGFCDEGERRTDE